METIIELFDSCQIKNIVAALRFKPKKVVYVGFKEVMKNKKIKDLKKFFLARGEKIELEFEFVGRYNYDSVITKLNTIIDTNKDCCFDLTGGKELVLAAMGEIASKRDIPMIQFNARTGNLKRIRNAGAICDEEKSFMSISESVMLNGGSICKDPGDFKWSLTEESRRDIEAMWEINIKDTGKWNKFSKALGGMEKSNEINEKLYVYINTGSLEEKRREALLETDILDLLEKAELISDKSIKNDVLTFRFKNEQIYRCLAKAGNILEIYTYMIATEIAEEEPGFYDDIKMGVILDWDGKKSEKWQSQKDTRNEIDVFLMRDLIPVFISCKNGDVNKEALYELNTVAEKLGGEYAKKVLVATFNKKDGSKNEFLVQRARDMQIEIIEDVDALTKEKFKEIFKKRIK